MDLHTSLQEAVENIPGCIACGYVDLSSQMMLSSHSKEFHPQENFDALADAASDLFFEMLFVKVDALFQNPETDVQNPDNPDKLFNEIMIFGDDRLNYFYRTRKHPDHVVCIICDGSANAGLVRSKARREGERLAQAL